MENIGELERQASEASLNRVSMNTIAIVNSIRTVGRDPMTNAPADGEDIGTASLGRWGNQHFILTARHVINEKAQPSDLRIFWRQTGSIERRSDGDLRQRDIADGVPISDPRAVIHRCSWEDLSVVAIDPKAVGQYAEFFDIANNSIDPLEGEFVSCCGFPIDQRILVDKRMVGIKEERTVAVRPDIFSGRVLPLPTERELRFQITSFDPSRHYLVPYEHSHSEHPRGFSGAALWWESDQVQLVWRPNFKFAGVCVSSYKKGTVVQVIKASIVSCFLRELFGAA